MFPLNQNKHPINPLQWLALDLLCEKTNFDDTQSEQHKKCVIIKTQNSLKPQHISLKGWSEKISISVSYLSLENNISWLVESAECEDTHKTHNSYVVIDIIIVSSLTFNSIFSVCVLIHSNLKREKGMNVRKNFKNHTGER